MAIPLLVSGVAFSGVNTAAHAQQPGDVRLRVARFWRGEGRTLLEGVVGLPVARNARNVELTVRDSTGKSLYSETWADSASAQAAALAAMNAETTTPLQVILRPGLYGVAIKKSEATRADSATMQVRGFDGAPVLSDVVVSASMRVLSEGEKPGAAEMQRGRYAIERSTRVMVSPSSPKLWYYVELYRQGADSVAQLEFRVAPEGKDSALVRITRSVAVGARGTVDAAALVVQGLPPGNYVLTVNAKSGSRQEQRTTPFSMGSFDTPPPAVAAAPTAAAPAGGVSESSLYDRYFAAGVTSDADINNMIEALTVAAPGERVSSENLALTTDAKRRFLARYWSRIPDPVAATPAHEFYDEFSQRVRYVEKEFREKAGRAGVKTDRGRIYMKYGAPDAAQLVQVSSGNKSVILWKYTRRKSLKYAFLDETGFENYNLVYTTDPLERTLHDWEQRVYDQDMIRQIVSF